MEITGKALEKLYDLANSCGLERGLADSGLIASGYIGWGSSNDLTIERKTDNLSIDILPHKDGLYALYIEKPLNDTAGDIIVYIYNVCTINNLNPRDCVLHTLHVPVVLGAHSTDVFVNLSGLFIGDGLVKIGAVFEANTADSMAVFYKLFRM